MTVSKKQKRKQDNTRRADESAVGSLQLPDTFLCCYCPMHPLFCPSPYEPIPRARMSFNANNTPFPSRQSESIAYLQSIFRYTISLRLRPLYLSCMRGVSKKRGKKNKSFQQKASFPVHSSCPLYFFPFLMSLSSHTQRFQKERKKERKRERKYHTKQ